MAAFFDCSFILVFMSSVSSSTMRAPGSISWAGIYNTEFWIDRERGVGGLLLMQYLPFYHPDAIETLQGFEALVYSGL